MKNVNRVVGRDGKVRLYLRKRGVPATPLQGAWETPELEAEIAGLIEALGKPKTQPGTLRAAAREYELGADFPKAESTRYIYLLMLNEMVADFGDVPLERFTPAFVLDLRDAWAPRGYRATNHRLQILKNTLKRPIIRGLPDPFGRIEGLLRPSDLAEPHVLWPDADFRVVMEAASPGLARGIAVGRYIGPRRADIVRLTEGARKDGRFSFLSGKRKVPVNVEEPPELTYWLGELRRYPGSLMLAYTEAGGQYTGNGFRQVLSKLVARLAKGGLVNPRLDVHGLRHTRGVDYALAGFTDAEGAAALGHRSAHSFAPYRRQADLIRLSDNGSEKLRRLRERTPNADVQNGVQNSCKKS